MLVWVDDKDKPIDFQLSFSNKVFTYMKCKLTYSVTDNAGRGYWWMAEILQQPSQKDRLTKNDEKEILTNFRKDAKDIDPIIINFVIERLLRYFNWE